MFFNKLQELRKEALDYILGVLRKRGTDYQLIDPQSIEDTLTDEYYELPRADKVDKHGFYSEFPIIAINIEDDKLVFVGDSSMDAGSFCDEYFEPDDLSSPIIFKIADMVKQFENE